MKIMISSGTPDEARNVTVEEEGQEPVSFKAKNLSEAHKMVQQGRKSGWDFAAKPKKEK